jgi:Ran GTPase-activating protein (RanGAP) involved in mRNA processing and transport
MDLSSLNLTNNDIPQIMQRAFRKEKKKYTNLVLRDNALTSMGVKILVDELLTTPTWLRNLGLSSNPGIRDAGVEHLVRLLQESRSITLLALHNTGITDRSVRLLADVLCDTNTNSSSVLEKLYISFNKLITDQSLEALIQILKQNQTLKVFSLQHCSLSDKARRRLRQIGIKKEKTKIQSFRVKEIIQTFFLVWYAYSALFLGS